MVITSTMRLIAAVGLWLALCLPATASRLVTGNGHGFTVVAPESGAATKFYPHPHDFVRSDPEHPLGEGIATANFIKALSWGEPGRTATADDVADSQVIRMSLGNGSGYFFMPFGLERPALIISNDRAWMARRMEQATAVSENGRRGPTAALRRDRRAAVADPLGAV